MIPSKRELEMIRWEMDLCDSLPKEWRALTKDYPGVAQELIDYKLMNIPLEQAREELQASFDKGAKQSWPLDYQDLELTPFYKPLTRRPYK